MQRFTWNGKILWFFVPHDWGQPMPNGLPRASGPFVNPDHFANYLSLILPIALGCALFRTFMVSKAQQYGWWIFCGFTAFLVFTGILLSLSRGGWISVLVGIVILVWLSSWGKEQRAKSRGQRAEGKEQRAKSREQGAGSREHEANRKEQGAGSREHEANGKEQGAGSGERLSIGSWLHAPRTDHASRLTPRPRAAALAYHSLHSPDRESVFRRA